VLVRPSCDWDGCVVEFLKPSQAEEELSMTIGLEREAQILRYYHVCAAAKISCELAGFKFMLEDRPRGNEVQGSI
jgi:hypothetical protein